MGLTLITAPTSEPLTLDEAKQHLRVDTSDDDGLIAGYILAARHWVESQVGPLMTQTWDYTVDGGWPIVNNRYQIDLPLKPVQSITSVSYVDSAGATQTLSASLYQTVLNTPTASVVRAYSQSWPTVRDQPACITVRFVAGYGAHPGSVPDPLRVAIQMLVGSFYEHREEVVIGQTVAQVPFGVQSLISPYSFRGF